MILLTHPVHGTKFASNLSEVEHDESFGWVRYTESTPTEAAPKRKYTRKVTEPTIEQPNEVPEFMTSASDESEVL